MNSLDEITACRIREANIRLHNEKAKEFDAEEEHMHKDRFIRKTWDYVNYIADHVSEDNPTLLDIGCGTGNLSLKFLEKGFVVKGVDISEGMIAIYKKNTNGRAEAVISDVDEFLKTEKNYYDVISFNAVLHHLPDYLNTISKSCERVKDGGYLFINYEHLSNKNVKKITKILEKVDVAVHGVIYKWQKHRSDFTTAILRKLHVTKNSQRSEDILLADYHVFEGGLREDEILETIRQHRYEIVKFDQYQLLRIDLLNSLANFFKLNGLFSIIAQRKNNSVED